MWLQRVVIIESKNGLGAGLEQNIRFEDGHAFVTGAFSGIDPEEKEYMIARLARSWNMTANLDDGEFMQMEKILGQHNVEQLATALVFQRWAKDRLKQMQQVIDGAVGDGVYRNDSYWWKELCRLATTQPAGRTASNGD